MTRRELLTLLAVTGAKAQQTGIASRGVAPQPRGKPSGLPFHARFTDIAAAAGLHEPAICGPVGHTDYILESMGCGIAFLDYDNDGWLDILQLSATRRDGPVPGISNRLYKNNRDGTFKDVTKEAGLIRQDWAMGVTVGDYNNDGFDDIFITQWGQNILYRNNGDGTFSDVTRAAGLMHEGTRWGTGCTWVDYNRDGLLDLFVANYLVFDFDKVPATGKNPDCNFKGVPVYYGPRGLPREHCLLYRNNGDGTFTDVTREAELEQAKAAYHLTAMTADYLGTGQPSIYVACDSTPSVLFVNQGNGKFAEQALEMGLAVNQDGNEQAGMGLGLGDIDTNGKLDLLKTHFSEDTSVLYRNVGQGGFDDISTRAGIGVETRYVGWGAGIQDFDNDGLPDLFWATGSVFPEVEELHPEYPFKTPRVLFRNLGSGKFEELGDIAGPAIGKVHSSRGVAFGDFDNDGDVDILIMNVNEPPSLLRNDVTGKGHWLKVKLVGVKSNRSAIGATVIASYGEHKQAQAVTAQSSYLSVNDRRLHFGLGTAMSVDLEVRWPNGGQGGPQGDYNRPIGHYQRGPRSGKDRALPRPEIGRVMRSLHYLVLLLAVQMAGSQALANTTDAMAHAGRAGQLMQSRRYSEAAAEFEQALAADPNNDAVRIQYASCLFAQERNEDARKQFEMERKRLGDKPGLNYFLAQLDLRADRFDLAIQKLEPLATNPAFPKASLYLGLAYMAEGEQGKALTSLELAAKNNPSDPEPHYRLGRVYSMAGRSEEAAREYKIYDGARETQRLVEEEGHKCMAALREQPLNQAREVCQKIADPSDARRMLLLGQLYVGSHAFPDAVEPLRTAVRLEPDLFDGWQNLGLSLYWLHRYREALPALEKAAELNPQFFDTLNLLAATYHALGNDAAALPVLERAHTLNPGDEKLTRALERMRAKQQNQ